MPVNVMQLEAFLLRKFGPVKRTQGKNGLELITRCPGCGKKKLSVNTVSGIYKCWAGCKGGHINQLMGEQRLSGLDTSVFRKAPEVKRDLEMPGELVPLTTLADDHHARTYLKRRGFDPVSAEQDFGMRYCRVGRKFAGGLFDTTNTIVVPVYMGGVLTGWQSRLLFDPDKLQDSDCEALGFLRDDDGDFIRPPKYFTAPGMKKGAVLWNYDQARTSDLVVVTEGVFDAMAVGRCSVATFGKGVSDAQKSLLGAYWKYCVCLLDPDAAADNAALERALGTLLPTVALTLEGYKDAGEAPRNEIWRQIDKALAARNIDLGKVKFIV